MREFELKVNEREQIEFRRYNGYVPMRESVSETLEWIDKELLDGRWLVTRWNAKNKGFGMNRTCIVRFRYGGVNKVRVMGKNKGDWDEIPLDTWWRIMERERGVLTDGDWDWVRKMRARLEVPQRKSRLVAKGEAWEE